ncbi:hypothetical protein K437DRAFT_72139 [Tilletiaria anomala UBC 951]|uniref:TOM13-domain-containing protein n=1 Tax=Tilletiaria anomala (strain ATCC 24038 / CBS 436.72 / UBC 951) TaxID=1037660 RepID=A0A066WR36_TILAU|nr:uncharacterized protein K437DRAFT_72139 [Tilletiaria anomala UBC 951]KDN53459.1 hypothetical protein K437DRAFT_72139 [Tilletiaria anomala UBC 951]
MNSEQGSSGASLPNRALQQQQMQQQQQDPMTLSVISHFELPARASPSTAAFEGQSQPSHSSSLHPSDAAASSLTPGDLLGSSSHSALSTQASHSIPAWVDKSLPAASGKATAQAAIPSGPEFDEEKRGDRVRRRRAASASSGFSDESSTLEYPERSASEPSAQAVVTPAPSGSLTRSIFTPGISPWRRASLLLASLAINLGLPFINGVMVGFGEIFARSVLAPKLGLLIREPGVGGVGIGARQPSNAQALGAARASRSRKVGLEGHRSQVESAEELAKRTSQAKHAMS